MCQAPVFWHPQIEPEPGGPAGCSIGCKVIADAALGRCALDRQDRARIFLRRIEEMAKSPDKRFPRWREPFRCIGAMLGFAVKQCIRLDDHDCVLTRAAIFHINCVPIIRLHNEHST